MRRILIALASTFAVTVGLFQADAHSREAQTMADGAGGPQGPSGAAPEGSAPGGSSQDQSDQGQDQGQPGQSPAPQQSGGSGTYTGQAIETKYGPVQVKVTVAEGQITDIRAINFPWKNHVDQSINGHAVPILNQEAMQAHSAQIDAVSGATYTSGAYKDSLQSALDQAGL